MTVALCAVESDPKPDDLYLDDAVHGALSAKFANDWEEHVPWANSEPWTSVMSTQKVRDAEEDLNQWLIKNQIRDALAGMRDTPKRELLHDLIIEISVGVDD